MSVQARLRDLGVSREALPRIAAEAMLTEQAQNPRPAPGPTCSPSASAPGDGERLRGPTSATEERRAGPCRRQTAPAWVSPVGSPFTPAAWRGANSRTSDSR
jgi:hypothetical protein